MSEATVSGRKTFKAFTWFFATLVMVALLSQPGASHDEWFHAANTWCGHGVSAPQCLDISEIDGVRIATTNMNPFNCQRLASDALHCPTTESNQGSSVMATGLYPPWFYFVLSWAVVSSPEVSFATVRIASALVISLVFGIMMWLLPMRHRTSFVLVALTGFSATGFFLFSSINPSSWTTAGIGCGWFSFHAAVVPSELSTRRRATLLLVGVVAFLMAVGSRYDAFPFVGFVVILVCLHALSVRFVTRQKQLLAAAITAGSVALICLEIFTPLSPLFHLSLLFKFSDGQPDNITFFTHNIIQGLPNAVFALGSVPTMSQVVLPQIVFVTGIAILVVTMQRTFECRNVYQTWGFISVSVVIAVAIATQVAYSDHRNQGFIEPRYVYPLFVFAVGWWFLLGPKELYESVSMYLKPLAVASASVFFLTMLTVAERFVDRQTFGVRYLPEGPDQWWWSWLPVGPNVVVILATFCVWMFFRQVIENEAETNCLAVHE